MKIIELFVYNKVDKILDYLVKMLTQLDKYVEAKIAEELAITNQIEELGKKAADVAASKQKAEKLKEKLSAIV